MAETLISPGYIAIENDASFVAKKPIVVGAAVMGPTVKGPTIPTIVSTWSEYVNVYGTTFQSGSSANLQTYSFLTSIAAYNYFANGGTSLLVGRVTSGTFAPATSSLIKTGSGQTTGTSPFILQTISQGTIMNTGTTETTGNVLVSGSSDNVRWQIVNANTSSGTFDLLIRQGSDSRLQPVILEAWTGLTLDPFSSNYISKVIGDTIPTLVTDTDGTKYIQYSGSYANKSNYIVVKQVNFTTPNYFNSNGQITLNSYTASIPLNQSGSFNGGLGSILTGTGKYYENISNTDTQGLVEANYTDMVGLFANKDEYKYNILLTPGLYYHDYSGIMNTIISNIENRGDAIYVADLTAYGKTKNDATADALSINSSYAASYWPWVQIMEPSTGQLVWSPASTVIGGVYAYNDVVSAPWFAPAGINRGGLSTVVRAERKLSQSDRDTLYSNKVNPITTFPGEGIVVYGQKTLQARASALDRVNVRRLLIALKDKIGNIANNLVFEQNTIATRNNFLSQVNPYLTSVQQGQGLYAFKVTMDDTNNTPDVIDRNELIGVIYLQPTKTAEFVYLNFNITPTGVTFPG